MAIRFLGQPFPDAGQIGEVIGSALEEQANDAAWFITAWGKQSGISRLAPALSAFRERGGRAEAILGVDEGGGTIEGLRLALELFDEVRIFHDPGARTFHPKTYVVQGAEAATAVIGSGNLTKGGLFTNYEAAIAATLDLTDEDDASFLADARAYFEQLATSAAAKLLTAELIEELKADPAVLLLSERKAAKARARRRQKTAGESVFGGQAVGGLLGAPPPAVQATPEEGEDDDDVLGGLEAPDAGAAADDRPGFFKALSNFDVSLNGSPGQIIIPIAFKPFFGELEIQIDKTAEGGPGQSHREFPLTFRDGTKEQEIENGRVILYEPAEAHKRPNPELRFTFHDREILKGLSKDDVLLFRREAGGIVVERRPAGWRPDGVGVGTRYGLI